MPFPKFLSPATSVGTAARSAIGGSPGSGRKLALSVTPQEQTNWCWAAVASSMSGFYGSGAWSQCAVANAALPRADCCGAGASDPTTCNTPWYLDAALTATDNLAGMLSRTLGFAEIQAEIGNDAPVCTRVGWFGGGGHFQSIVGWFVGHSGVEYIEVSDPIYLDAQIAYASFASSYQSGGDWTHSYTTRAPAAAGGMAASASAIYDRATIGA